MSVKGKMSQFAWRCAQPEKHDRHRIDGDGYYGPAGYICDGEPPRQPERCRVYWGSHGCDLPRDHAGWHICGQQDPDGPDSTSRDWLEAPTRHGMPLFGEDAMSDNAEVEFDRRSVRFLGHPSGLLDDESEASRP